MHMRDRSQGGIKYRVSKNPIQVNLSNLNLNISDNVHSGI